MLLMSDVGAGTISNATLVLSDLASLNLPASGAVVSGFYKPTNFDTMTDGFSPGTPAGPTGQSLALFNGLDPNGAWSLYVEDDAGQGVGSLEGWSLAIESLSPACCVPDTLVNHAPLLAPVPDQVIYEGDTLSLTNVATDSDLPAQTLLFALTNPPTGAMIVSNTGVFHWTPDESQGPGVYTVIVRVSDSGSPSLSTTQSFNITVLETTSRPC